MAGRVYRHLTALLLIERHALRIFKHAGDACGPRQRALTIQGTDASIVALSAYVLQRVRISRALRGNLPSSKLCLETHGPRVPTVHGSGEDAA